MKSNLYKSKTNLRLPTQVNGRLSHQWVDILNTALNKMKTRFHVWREFQTRVFNNVIINTIALYYPNVNRITSRASLLCLREVKIWKPSKFWHSCIFAKSSVSFFAEDYRMFKCSISGKKMPCIESTEIEKSKPNQQTTDFFHTGV